MKAHEYVHYDRLGIQSRSGRGLGLQAGFELIALTPILTLTLTLTATLALALTLTLTATPARTLTLPLALTQP